MSDYTIPPAYHNQADSYFGPRINRSCVKYVDPNTCYVPKLTPEEQKRYDEFVATWCANEDNWWIRDDIRKAVVEQCPAVGDICLGGGVLIEFKTTADEAFDQARSVLEAEPFKIKCDRNRFRFEEWWDPKLTVFSFGEKPGYQYTRDVDKVTEKCFTDVDF